MSLKDRLYLAKQGLQIVGKSLFNGYGAYSQTINPQTYNGLNNSSNQFWFFGNNGIDRLFTYSSLNDCVKAYECCPPLAAIVNKKAQSYINAKTIVENKLDKKKQSLTAQKIIKRLQNPNFRQSQSQFEAQGYIYQQLFGFNVLLTIKPVGYKNNLDAKEMWNIPPNLLDFKEVEYAFTQQESGLGFTITLTEKNRRTVLDNNNIFIFKDFSPSFQTMYLPESRIKALQQPINNIIGAYESRNVLITRRGALGIISSDKGDDMGNRAMSSTEKEDLQTDYLKYGLSKSQHSIILTTAGVKYQQMGYSTKDLMLFEEVESSTMAICDSYGYPYPLLSSNRTNNLGGGNITESEKSLYQNTIIPEATSITEQWNNYFGIEDINETLVKDFSHIAALQEDDVKRATASLILNQSLKMQYEAGLITLDEWSIELGRLALPDNKGQVRATDTNNANVPLANIIGVGGVTSFVGVLQASGLSSEARAATLSLLFGINEVDAALITANNVQQQV